MTHIPRFNIPNIGKVALMLQWLTYRNKPIYREINHYPTYFYYDYGIDNPQHEYYELVKFEYLNKMRLQTSLNFYTVADLLDICSSLGVITKGNKTKVIAYLMSLGKDDEIEQLLPHGPCYGLTQKGKDTVLQGRKHVPEEHQHLFEINSELNKTTIEMR